MSSRNNRILSGMRPTGRLHLGNYHGALKNWVKLQHEYECYFMAADLHALTTSYDDTINIDQLTWEMITDWLAAGLDPKLCKIFIQSEILEHAQLHLLLSMITPLSWLERVPTYKDQQEKLKEKDLSTYGFLGYPLLQSADILLYKPAFVPVGEDQVPHVELTREVARRFNHVFGRESNFVDLAEQAIRKMGKKHAKLYKSLLQKFQQQGCLDSLGQGRELVNTQPNLSNEDQERLLGYLEGSGKQILEEPRVLLTETPKYPGLDGQKMSKSYNNTIYLVEEPDSVNDKIKKMQTDPARVRRTDPGNPDKCPVWEFHKIHSDDDTKQWVISGCKSASIGCIDCKKRVADKIISEQAPIVARAKELRKDPGIVRSIVNNSTEEARDMARETLAEVNAAIGIAQL